MPLSSQQTASTQPEQRPSDQPREKRFRAAHQITQDKVLAKQVQQQWKAEHLIQQGARSTSTPASVKEEKGEGDSGETHRFNWHYSVSFNEYMWRFNSTSKKSCISNDDLNFSCKWICKPEAHFTRYKNSALLSC